MSWDFSSEQDFNPGRHFYYPRPRSRAPREVSVPENQVGASFFVMRILLWGIGRFPFSASRKNKISKPLDFRSGGKLPHLFKYSKSIVSFHLFYFIFTTSFLFVSFTLLTLGFAKAYLEWETGFLLNYPNFTRDEHEKFDENLVPFVLTWSCMLNTIVGSLSFIINRQKFIQYFNDWEELILRLGFRFPNKLRYFLIASNIWCTGFLLTVCFFFWFRFLEIAVGGPQLIVLLQLKLFVTKPLENQWSSQWLFFGLFTLIYTLYSSRALLFIFAFHCRLLSFCFHEWNNKLLLTLKKQESHDGLSMKEKITCESLFREHCLLVAKVHSTNKLFGGIMQSYYATQILNLCFELYYLARSGLFPGSNGGNILAAILLLVQNMSVFFTVSLDASRVQSAAYKGSHILKQRGHFPHDKVYHRYLMSNLRASFSERIVITGGGFFRIDKPFVLKVLGAVCTYFVIILQFGDRIQPTTEE